jgi:hypothetical protein
MVPMHRFLDFYQTIAGDSRIGAGHIGLYMAFLQQWATGGYQEPFSISRSQIMKLARINGKATYHKYMRELVEFGYIEYTPSYNPFLKSLLSFK